jgi:chromatin segregation and condensation protein Rec8/ScpA/Scc1 (kleisin family)
LNEQDNRPYFNVRQYGQGVLDKFEERGLKTKGKLTLRDVVGSDPQVYEVIRIFMASLHLANSGNVDIKVQGTDLSLVLKSTALHDIEVA